MSRQSKVREPLFHISKNDSVSFGRSLGIRAISIVSALVFVGLMSMILIKENPFKIYMAIFQGAFIDPWTLFQSTALLLMFGLAIIPAFQMKFWNLGANGQVLVGCLASIACMKFLPVKFPNLPNWLLLIIMFIASVVASCVWSVIPAIFKAFFNTNETLFTLMMNYIALTMIDFFVFTWDKTGSGTLGIVNLLNGRKGWMPDLGNKYLLPIIISVLMTALMFVYMKFTKHGFEVSLVGESVNTAKYVGINVKKVIIRTLLLGGIICGILGFLYASTLSHTVNQQIGGLGFTAILVAWLANFDSVAMLFTSFFVVFLDTGSKYVSTQFQLNSNDYANIVVGIIFFFVIGCEFFIRYKVNFSPLKFDWVKWDKPIKIYKRKVGICILLSIVTFGIYGIVWAYLLVKDNKAIRKDESSCVGEMLCLMLIPYYSIYWFITKGKCIKRNFSEHGHSAVGNWVIYMVFAILNLNIVSMAIMQSDFNSLPSVSTQSIQQSTTETISEREAMDQ